MNQQLNGQIGQQSQVQPINLRTRQRVYQQPGQTNLEASRITFFGIGEPVSFSFLGVGISLTVFVLIIVIITAIKDILEAQNIIW